MEIGSYTPLPTSELLVGQPLRLSVRFGDVDAQAAHARWNLNTRDERRASSIEGRPFDAYWVELSEVTPLRLAPGLFGALSLRITRAVPGDQAELTVDPESVRALFAAQAPLAPGGVSVRGRVLSLGVDLPLSWTQAWEPGVIQVEAVYDTREVDPSLGWRGRVTACSRALSLRRPEGALDGCVVADSLAAYHDVHGHLAEAREQLQRVVALDDHFEKSRVLLRLSDLCVRMGDEAGGLDALQRYLSRFPEGNPEHLEPLRQRRHALLASLQAAADSDER